MGVVKNRKNKTKNECDKKIVNGNNTKQDEKKVKKKKKLSCLQCIRSSDDGGQEGKYRVAAPELMQDTFMSDSEDEGGEVECPIQQQQQYRYMNSEAGTLHRAKPLEDSVTDGHLWPSNNDRKVATIERQPVDIGFLVSFVVDARGGAMKAKRRGGVRIIVPPAACAAPTRVTCRAATRRAPAAAPPPLMEGEALASRLLELQPQGAKFLQPVILEVPIFTASCPEREIVILRSDTGETWQDHYLHNNDNPLIQEALAREKETHGSWGEAIGEGGVRVTRVVTCDFPHYLAVVSRVRQEVHVVGPEGGNVASTHIPQVQALFPPHALTKRIRVGLQAHRPASPLARRHLPRHCAASPVLSVEPRRRKFHASITLTQPLPATDKPYDKQSTANLRLLCSIMGGQARAVWEDVTGSTPLTITNDCASFTTTVSARFWLMHCQNVADATKLATELYREMLLVPFEVRIVVLGKRLDSLEGRLLVMYITDRYAYDTLLQQEHYTEVAHSTAVRFLDGKEVYLEFSGNLVPVTKSGSQPMFTFEAFKDNRVEFPVRIKHQEDTATGRIYFMNEPKVAKGEQSQTPACVLDVELPTNIAPRAGKSQIDCLNLDQSGFDALNDELSFHWGDHNHSSGPPSIPNNVQINGHDKIISNGHIKQSEKDEQKDPQRQLNGDSLNVDSNNIKATFDSDEDKTPMNTLEKGKRKPEGFLDKVKNVFTSDDKETDSKESSPKPQPKPRESKDKSPPKPAPRIINEELLDKVDDMFKDLHSKPPRKEEVYATKLVIDEDIPFDMKNITDEIPDDYASRQPIDTPLQCKTVDPFQFYTGCCEGRFAKGQKHTHDETSTVVDRIEQVKFSANEKLQDISDRADNAVNDGVDAIQKEKERIKKQANEDVEKIQVEITNKEAELCNKKKELENNVEGKLEDLNDLVHQAQNNVNSKAKDVQHSIDSNVDSAKNATKDVVDHLSHIAGEAKDHASHKVQVLDFLAKEKEEELKIRSQEAKKVSANFLQNAQDNLSHKAQEIESEIADAAEHAKDSASEKINNAKEKTDKTVADLKSKASDAKEEIKKEGKKKSKGGKNFISGLVHNIFGEKEKIEDEVKGKIAEGQETADDLLEKAAAKKDEVKESIEKKQAKVKDGAESLMQDAKNKKHEVEQSVHETKDQITKAVSDKTQEINKTAQDKINQLESTIHETGNEVLQSTQEKKNDLENSIHETKDQVSNAVRNKTEELTKSAQDKVNRIGFAIEETEGQLTKAYDEKKSQVQEISQSELERITQEAEKTTEQIKKSAEDIVNAVADKKAEFQANLSNKTNELQQSGKHEVERLQDAAGDKVNDLRKSSKQAFDSIQDSALSSFDKVESSAKDKVSDAKDTWEDLQSSTRDTFADFKDDVHGLESSAQDTLHSFQSSAGNTFDSLDDSAREFIGGVQNRSEQIFDESKDSFEGFQISADNKIQDVRNEAHEVTDDLVKGFEDSKDVAKKRLEEAGARLTEGAMESEQKVLEAVTTEADQFTSSLNDLGNSVFGFSGKGFMKDSSTKLLESEKAQSSPSPNKKGKQNSSGIPKLKRKK